MRGKPEFIKLSVARLEYMRAVDLVRHLRNEKMNSIVENDNYIIIARYGTNKVTLRRKLA